MVKQYKKQSVTSWRSRTSRAKFQLKQQQEMAMFKLKQQQEMAMFKLKQQQEMAEMPELNAALKALQVINPRIQGEFEGTGRYAFS